MHLTSIDAKERSVVFVGRPGAGILAARAAETVGANVRIFGLADFRCRLDRAPGEPLVVADDDTEAPVELIGEARSSSASLPILFLTGEVTRAPRALAAGATDFVLTSASQQEFAIRLRQVLDAAAREPLLERQIGEARLARDTRTLSAHGRSVQLSPIEMQLLECLASQAGKVVSRAELERSIWGFPAARRQTSNVAVVYVSYLRAKLAKLGSVCRISTFPKQGYMLELEEPAPVRPSRRR